MTRKQIARGAALSSEAPPLSISSTPNLVTSLNQSRKNLAAAGLAAFVLSALSFPAYSFPQACLQAFSADLKPETEFIRSMNSKVNATLAESPNRTAIGDFLKKDESKAGLDNGSLVTIAPDSTVGIWRGGVGNPDLILLGNSKKSVRLFSSDHLSKNHAWAIESISVSPDKSNLIIISTKHGALDKFRLDVMDLQTQMFIGQEVMAKSSNVHWASDKVLYYDPLEDVSRPSHGVIDLEKGLAVSVEPGRATGSGDWTAVIDNGQWVISNRRGRSVRIAGQFGSVVGEDVNYLYLKISGAQGLGEVRRIPKIVLKSREEALKGDRVIPEPFIRQIEGSMITSAELAKDKFFIKRRWGANLSIQILNKDGSEIATVPIPTSLRAISIREGESPNLYKVRLSSAVSASIEYVYDIETKKWDRETFEADLLTIDGVPVSSEIVEYESAGGKIPVRIVKRKDLVPDGTNPVFIEVYGGFMTTGKIDGNRTPMKNEFVKRGGILAFPAVRGGNEFGSMWYQAAVKQNKKNTMLDLIAGARWLAKSGWSKPEKIAITGASNGGFVVASAALMAPDAFGLILPAAGVLDPGSIDKLDTAVFGDWIGDYGDPRVPAERQIIDETSPVELAKKLTPGAKLPKFLVVVGLEDDRVNALHSERFAKVMREKAPDKLNLIGLKNSGHFVTSPAYSGLIGLRASTAMWTYIFDTLGMKF